MSEWISVKDRLPEDVSSYLVSRSDLDPPIAVALWEDGKWWEDFGDDDYGGVTHWMTIPPPPEPQLTVKEALALAVYHLDLLERRGFYVAETFITGGGVANGVFTTLLPRLRAALEAE